MSDTRELLHWSAQQPYPGDKAPCGWVFGTLDDNEPYAVPVDATLCPKCVLWEQLNYHLLYEGR